MWSSNLKFPRSSFTLTPYASVLSPTLGDPMDCGQPGSSIHGFSRQEDWSELPCPPPWDLPAPGTEHVSCGSCTAGGILTSEPAANTPY